uniref:CNNM transmembrane domain-containing protein n=3 Tax=Salix viminalis TaxID=40686 RepID=A0A6N2NDK0_SALVM
MFNITMIKEQEFHKHNATKEEYEESRYYLGTKKWQQMMCHVARPMFWTYLIICMALVCFAGLMSGLTLGLMSLSVVDLEILIKAGHPQERKNAEKILPIVKNQHLLLCTLLIGNAMAMEALPIFIDALLPAWGAILISVTLILAFGEIIPQAVCSRYGLSIGAKLSIVVRFIVIVLFPLAYPISKHSALLRRAELKTLVDMHGNEVRERWRADT